MSNAVWGLGFSIVDTRRRKLIKRLMATPMSRVALSGLVPHLAADAVARRGRAARLRSARIAFGVPIRGIVDRRSRSSVSLGSLMFSALGILVGSRARTIEGVSGLMNLVDHADVDRVRRVLFRAAVPGLRAADHQGAAAHAAASTRCARFSCRA